MKKTTGHILLSPRITEKAAYKGQDGVYVFNVAKDANKYEIAQAIFEAFKVRPRKIAVVHTPRKYSITRGTNRVGKTASGKKAYVYLKKGETIEIV